MIQSGVFIGLFIIALAWLMQAYSLFKDNKRIRKRFMIMYALGTCVYAIDSWVNSDRDIMYLNYFILAIVLVSLIKLSAKDKVIVKAREIKRKKKSKR
jgi:hypothetical protein